MIILVMGVAGSGKTTLGRRLAATLGWTFADADDFHPPENIAKMAAGQPLDDRDRAPWLAALRAHLDACLARGESTVVTCSALKQRYREALIGHPENIRLVYLHGSRDLLLARLAARRDHFMGPAMLDSQLAALEPPADALPVDVTPPPDVIVADIRRGLGLP